MLVLEQRLKGSYPDTGCVQQGLEEGKMEAWCVQGGGSWEGRLGYLERCRMPRTAAIMGDIVESEHTFYTTDPKNMSENVTQGSSDC